MSLADHELEEPDERLCAEHQRVRPCYLCQLEAAEARMESLREDGE